jgi:hypothetical protein
MTLRGRRQAVRSLRNCDRNQICYALTVKHVEPLRLLLLGFGPRILDHQLLANQRPGTKPQYHLHCPLGPSELIIAEHEEEISRNESGPGRTMFKPEDPFPTPKDLLDTCHTFFSSCHTGGASIEQFRTGEGNSEGQALEPRGRMERMLSGWVYRDLQVDLVSPFSSCFTVLRML